MKNREVGDGVKTLKIEQLAHELRGKGRKKGLIKEGVTMNVAERK